MPEEEKKSFPIAKKRSFDINNLIFHLIRDEPFFADILKNVSREVVSGDIGIKTAAVSFNAKRGRFVLYFNPEFMSYLKVKQQRAIVKHEIFHIIFNHLTSRKPKDTRNHKVWNIATDLAINSHLVNDLPSGVIIPCLNPKEPAEFCIPAVPGSFEKFEPFHSSEWYYNELLKDSDFAEQCSETCDDHSKWGENDGTGEGSVLDNSEIIKKAEVRRLVESANNSAIKKGWGSVPESVRKDIQLSLKNTVNWKSILRFFIKKSQRGSKYSTFKRVNRRWRDSNGNPLAPGRGTTRHSRIAIAVDESGSMSDGFIASLIGELQSLAKIATFTVIPFDTEVCEESIFVWKKGEKLRGNYKRTSQGGTNFDAPVRYANEKDFDGLIILTDMCAPSPKSSKMPRMWLTSEKYLDEHRKSAYLDTGRDLVLSIPPSDS